MPKNQNYCCAPNCDDPISGHRVLCETHYFQLDPDTRFKVTEYIYCGAFGLAVDEAQRFFRSEALIHSFEGNEV
jgi:hypothetical protein